MSEFLNLQAALGQTSVLSGPNGANARGVSGDGGFGAVLGAVMADSMGGFAAADTSAAASVGVSRAEVPADGEDVSEGAAVTLEADKAAKALAELYGALESLDGSDELPDVMFTAEGAKAFISVLERYISQGNIPSKKDIEALWKDVSADEKDAYADILGAIALGSVVLPDENDEMFEVSSEDVLGFVLKEAGKLAMRPTASKKSDKDEEEAASYIMSVFIAPSFSVGMETENGELKVSEGDNASAALGDMSLAAGETTWAAGHTAENMPEADARNTDGENAGAASTFSMSELGEAIAERIFEADPDYAGELEKFCGELANELKAEVAKDIENAERAFAATPEDIGRQAFMARVSAPVHETNVTLIEAALRQNAADSAYAGDVPDDGTANGETEVSLMNAGNDSISDKAMGEITENDKNIGMNASEGAVRNAAVQATQATQGSRVFETEETDSAEDVPVSPMDTEEIARRISEHISKGRNESITLRLDPEDLGEIKVTISRKAGETVVAFEAHKSESAQILGDRAAALAESLAAKGIAVREISVTDMSNGNNADRNGNGNNAGSNAKGGDFYGGNRQADTDGANNGNASGKGYSRHYYFEEPEETPTADENYFYI